MAGSVTHGREPFADVSSIVAAFAGSSQDAEDLPPAFKVLQRACSSASIWLLWPAGICSGAVASAAAGRIDYPLPEVVDRTHASGIATERASRSVMRPSGRTPVKTGSVIEPSTSALASRSLFQPEPGAVETTAALEVVQQLKACAADMAIVFTPLGVEPYTAAYYCYLAGISVRAGSSMEFGGAVLSHGVRLPVAGAARHLALLRELGIGSVRCREGAKRQQTEASAFVTEDRCDP